MKRWVNIGMNEQEINMNYQASEKALLENVREELDRSCDRLDGHTQSRLNSIRHAALEHAQKNTGRMLLAPFGGLVTACLLLVIVMGYYPQQSEVRSPDIPAVLPMEDLDILTSNESLDFFENLEFYNWIEENESSV